jgi:hypothetical protein
MDDVTKQAILSAVRTVIGTAGGALAAHGFISSTAATELAGAIMVILTALWGVWDKYRSETETKKREAVAVNVGIAVADRTVGTTPVVPADKTPAVIEEFKPVLPPEVAKPEVLTTGLKIDASSPVLPPAK